MFSPGVLGSQARTPLLLLMGAVLAGAISPAVHADTDGYACGYVASDTLVSPTSPYVQGASIGSAILNLRLHNLTIEYAPPGTTGLTTAQLAAVKDRIRADFAPHQIYFYITDQPMPVPSAYYFSSHPTELLDTKIGPESDTIDVVLGPAVPAAIRGEGTSWGSDMMVPTRCLVNLVSDEDFPVVSHELGHCLGLVHTNHYNGNPSSACGPEARCNVCQDNICDTPYDMYLSEPMWNHVDRATCQYDGQYPEHVPPFHNIMAYTWPRCMTEFTPGQRARMLRTIEVTTHLQRCLSNVTSTYENKSADTGLLYVGTPYGSVAFDYDGDSDKDLFITMRDAYGSLQQQLQLTSGIPQFVDRTEYDFAPGSEPQAGLRGATAADHDNDGRVDLFVAADLQPRLYHNNSTPAVASFADSAGATGLAALADSSYAGAWGDFDRDGRVDLYVCRGSGVGNDPTAANVNPMPGKLLRNDTRTSRTFADRSDSLGAAGSAHGATVAASWADVDGDKDLDLFVGDLRDAGASASSRLYLNNGAGKLTDSFAGRFVGLNVKNVNSVVWADMNNDAALDLVLGSESAPPTVYFNNGGGRFDVLRPLATATTGPSNGVRSVDCDLDGRQDVLVLPRSNSSHRWMFWNLSFDGEIVLADQSSFVGFTSTGRVDGVAIADFNGDGDGDMYFGRPESTDDYFYRARSPGGDQPSAHWVGVRLVGGGGNNRSAVGAKVRFSYTGFQQVQVVDGGSGKGGQADNVLTCGLGTWNSPISVQVTWPGGYVQTVSASPGVVTTIEDATVPEIAKGKTTATYNAYPNGWADWVFCWETNFSCDPALDKVTVSDRPGEPGQCATGTVVLTPATFGVQHSVLAMAGGGYKHTLVWCAQECIAPCRHNYVVESATATDASYRSTSLTRTLNVGVCIGE